MEKKHRSSRRRQRRRVLAKIFGAVVTVALLAVGARYIFAPRDNDFWIAAEKARQSGDLKAAVINYKNVLQRNSHHLEARWRLGETYLALKQPLAALSELELAEPLIVTHPEIVLAIARAQLAVGKYNPALVTLGGFGGRRTADVDALEAQARIGLGQRDEAKTLLSKATAQDPGAASLQLAMARLAVSQNDFAGAKAALNKALELAPNDAEAWLMRGRIAMLQRETAEAEVALRKAIELSPDKTEAQAALAEALLSAGKAEAAAPVIEALNHGAAKTLAVEYLNGWLAYARSDWPGAESLLMNVIKLAPKHPQALLMVSDALYRQNKFDQAELHLKSFDGFYPNQPVARKLLGAALLKQHKAHEAVTFLAPLVTGKVSDAGLLSLLSYAYFASGEQAKGAKFLHQAEALAPNSNALQAQHALGELMTGNTDAGIAELEKLATTAPDPSKPRELLTYAHLLKGDDKNALESALALVELKPDDPTAQNLFGIAEYRAGEPAKAEAAFLAALKINPKYAPALTNLGMLALAKNDEANARTKLTAALAADQSYTQAALLLAALDERAGKPAAATQRLEAAAAAAPQASQPRWLLATRTLRAGDRDAALKWAQQAHALEPNAAQSRARWGEFKLAAGQPQAAYETLEALHRDEPKLLQVTYLFAQAAQATQRATEARAAYQVVLAAQPKIPNAWRGLFALELSAKNYPKAKEILANMRQALPDSADADLAEAELAARQGDTATVATILRASHAKAPTTASALRLAAVLAQQNKPADARTVLNDWLGAHPTDVAALLQLGSLALTANDRAEAQKVFEEVLKATPDNPVALNNLAWLYDEGGDDRALGLAERASQALPNSAQAADTLGWILVRKDKVERGLKLLHQAQKTLPSDPNVGYHLAYGLAESGDKSQAQPLLEKVLKDHPTFDSRKDAQALQRRLRAGATDAPLRF